MSFKALKVAELRQVAEDFAVDTTGVKGKADLIALLADEGVSWEMYAKAKGIEDNEGEDDSDEVISVLDPTKPIAKDRMLVKMTRDNFRYDILGKTFTKEHPFVAMSQDEAQAIFNQEEGFRIATPNEVQDFYG